MPTLKTKWTTSRNTHFYSIINLNENNLSLRHWSKSDKVLRKWFIHFRHATSLKSSMDGSPTLYPEHPSKGAKLVRPQLTFLRFSTISLDDLTQLTQASKPTTFMLDPLATGNSKNLFQRTWTCYDQHHKPLLVYWNSSLYHEDCFDNTTTQEAWPRPWSTRQLSPFIEPSYPGRTEL